MLETNLQCARLMAEILRIQRWAAGSDAVSAARIFGLLHGFESVIHEEEEGSVITAETQTKVEDLLADVESGEQATDGPAIKDRLRQEEVAESDASLVMQLCLLQNRYSDGVKAVAAGRGSVFSNLSSQQRAREADWFGALHYMELVDSTDGVHKKMHAVFSACVPRVGETVEPQGGSTMRVVNVEYVAAQLGDSEGVPQAILIPHVILEALDDEE